jgi:hypothetical protein
MLNDFHQSFELLKLKYECEVQDIFFLREKDESLTHKFHFISIEA